MVPRLLMIIGILMFIGLGFSAWPQDLDESARARAFEIFQTLADSGFSSPKELVDDWLDALTREFGVEHPVLLMALNASGRAAFDQGNYAEALRLFARQVELAEKTLGPEHSGTLTAMSWLAGMAGKMGDFSRAHEIEQEIVSIRRRLLGREHPDTLKALANLAGTLRAQGDYVGAQQRYEEVLEASRRLLGPKHPDTLKALASLAGNLYAQGDFDGARQWYEEVLEARRSILGEEHPDTLTALANLAGTLRAQGDFVGARERYEEVLEASSRLLGREHPHTLKALANLAGTLRAQGNFVGARARYEEVLEASRRLLGDEHPDTLTALANFAGTLRAQGNFDGARQHYEEVLVASRRLFGDEHPDTLKALANFAGTLRLQGDFVGARQRYEEVLQARRRLLGDEHPDTLTAFSNLAGTLYAQGDFDGARQSYEEVLEARRQLLGDEHPDTLIALANLAGALRAQGDFVGARKRYEEVLDTRRRLFGEEHPDTLTALANLAGTLYAQGDFVGARRWFEKVLEARRSILGKEHPETLTAFANLAGTLRAQGDLVGARKRYEEVLEASRRVLGPEHPDTLTVLANLARTLRAQGDFGGARRRYEEVLEARRRIFGEEHPDTSAAMHNLGLTLKATGDVEGAQSLLEAAVEIEANLRGAGAVPSTLEEAKSLLELGKIYRESGRPKEASRLLLATLDALEHQTIRLDLSEDLKSRFRARNQESYRVAIEHFLDLEQPDEAFYVLERYRAQSLLTLLRWGKPGEADSSSSGIRGEIPKIARRIDAVTTELDGLTADHEERAGLLAEQIRLQRRLVVLRGRGTLTDSKKSANRQPPLRADEIRNRLDPGTTMLAYSVDNEHVDLFVLTKESPLESYSLSVTEFELWTQLAHFFTLLLDIHEAPDLTSPEQGQEANDSDARVQLGRWLYEKLLAPAGQRLVSGQRLLILPDGPLHYLPFNALVRPSQEDQRGWQYLVEWKPIHIAQSATVYAELQKRRRATESEGKLPPQTLVALGDPSYPLPRDSKPIEPTGPDEGQAWLPSAVRSAESRGLFELKRLPNTYREVIEIGKIFTEAKIPSVHTYVGVEATEERAKRELSQARYIHLAAHGLVDPDVPDNSFIALTIPEGLSEDRDNGILQGWEIMDTLRLDADLVVLSACVTAFGPNRGGEGILSLSRAFQIAGAHTVAASLWPVADDSTAELMIRFYRHLLNGQTKDEALRAAQIELITSPIEYVNAEGKFVTSDFRAPYHWAAFQLIGDWQ